MKKFIIAIMALCALAFGTETIQGQKAINSTFVKWTTGANVKTRLMFHIGNVYLDTSTTGQAGAWKRIDNTADSCSRPFLITADSTGSTRPIWEYRLWQVAKSVNTTLGLHVYRIQTRERVIDSSMGRQSSQRWTPWTMKGTNTGYLDVTVQDSVLMPSPRLTSKASQYSFGFVAGTQARLCPDNAPTTSASAGDSVIVDSLMFYAR